MYNVQLFNAYPFPHLREQPVMPEGFFRLVGQSHRVYEFMNFISFIRRHNNNYDMTW